MMAWGFMEDKWEAERTAVVQWKMMKAWTEKRGWNIENHSGTRVSGGGMEVSSQGWLWSVRLIGLTKERIIERGNAVKQNEAQLPDKDGIA